METRACQNCKKDFVIEPDDFDFYERIKVPPPTFCPECRVIRRMSFLNDRNFHKRRCDKTGEICVSLFPEDFKTPVYSPKALLAYDFDAINFLGYFKSSLSNLRSKSKTTFSEAVSYSFIFLSYSSLVNC